MVRHRVLQENRAQRSDAKQAAAALDEIAAAINEALRMWVEKRRYADAVRRDQDGYRRHPVDKDEFEPVLGAQTWPK